MKKKVLIVTYYWPPAGGPGVQRWLKFAKYLPKYGFEPVIYTPSNPNYPLIDNTLENEVPEGISVLKNPIKEPYFFANLFSKKQTTKISSGIISEEKEQSRLQKLMLYIRGNFFIPDARVLWVNPSVNFLTEYIKENNIETIITTGPPHSLHLIGLGLQKKLEIKWIADFRDPWTSIGYHKKLKLSSSSQRKHKHLEWEVLNAMDSIITTSFTTKSEFEKITSKPIRVITNGYDYEKVEKLPLDTKFTLAHIGSMLSGRNPENLWLALSEIISEDKNFSKDFELKLIGSVSNNVLRSIQKFGLETFVTKKDYVSHKTALEIQRSSQVLLLLEIDSEETKGIIPGKLFEYMVSGRPIIGVGPTDSDIEKIMKETNTGRYFSYSEKPEIKTHLIELFNQFKAGNLKSAPIGLQKYSREALTGDLAQVINNNN
ncbi:MAG TPA: glycosyltransferase family 4 protein [Salinimicrobium sp.]|nr:glycosyltransferase family 4 protein [Salinimicrobium sp.]